MLILIGPTTVNGVWTAASLALPTPCLDMQAKIGAPLKQWSPTTHHFQGANLQTSSYQSSNVANSSSGSINLNGLSPRSSCSGSSSSISLKMPQNGRYKTEMCRTFRETGTCRYGEKCQYAHGMNDLKLVDRHPKYKTELCRTFHTDNFCKYGERCHFVHNDANGNPLNRPLPQDKPKPMPQPPAVIGLVAQQAYMGVPLMLNRTEGVMSSMPLYTQYMQRWDSSSAGEESNSSGPSSSGSNTPSSFSPGLGGDKECHDDPFASSYDTTRLMDGFMTGYNGYSAYLQSAATPVAHNAPLPVSRHPKVDDLCLDLDNLTMPTRNVQSTRRLPVFARLAQGHSVS